MKNMKEGDVINSILYRKFVKENKNFLAVVVGPTGSGKSWTCLKVCELWYEKYFHQKYPINNIGWNPSDIMERVVNGNLPEGSLLILEEGGTSMGSLDFQNKVAKLFNYILQSFRSKNIGMIVNLPNFSSLNKQTRMLMHMLLQLEGIDRAQKKTIVSPYHLQYNQQTGKLYRHKPKVLIDGVMEKIKFLNYSKPSQELIDEYEKRKNNFVDTLSKDVLKDMNEYLSKRKPLTELQLKILGCWKKGILNQIEIGKVVGKDRFSIGNNEAWMRKKGYVKEEFKEKDALKACSA